MNDKGASAASGGNGAGVGPAVPEGESAYHQRVDELLSRLDAAFADVDPDLAESDYAQGTLVVTFRQAHKLIVSPQTPLRQIWAAFRDRAWHFALDEARGCWLDDRGQGVELVALVASLAREHAGVEIAA
jgi:iron donor protein CyaY